MSIPFGDNLRRLRTTKGYTQAQVAKLLRIDRTTYTKYETGQSRPDFEILRQICRLFDVDYNTILDN